jgi:hypothetical protein
MIRAWRPAHRPGPLASAETAQKNNATGTNDLGAGWLSGATFGQTFPLAAPQADD